MQISKINRKGGVWIVPCNPVAVGTPYVLIRLRRSAHTGSRGGLFRKAFLYYQLHREEFLEQYHSARVETTFHMIKCKFRDSVRSKGKNDGDYTSHMNEVYAKVLCDNIFCLIQSIYELGIRPEFLIEQAA